MAESVYGSTWEDALTTARLSAGRIGKPAWIVKANDFVNEAGQPACYQVYTVEYYYLDERYGVDDSQVVSVVLPNDILLTVTGAMANDFAR